MTIINTNFSTHSFIISENYSKKTHFQPTWSTTFIFRITSVCSEMRRLDERNYIWFTYIYMNILYYISTNVLCALTYFDLLINLKSITLKIFEKWGHENLPLRGWWWWRNIRNKRLSAYSRGRCRTNNRISFLFGWERASLCLQSMQEKRSWTKRNF